MPYYSQWSIETYRISLGCRYRSDMTMSIYRSDGRLLSDAMIDYLNICKILFDGLGVWRFRLDIDKSHAILYDDYFD